MANQLLELQPLPPAPQPHVDPQPQAALSDLIYLNRPRSRGRTAVSLRTTIALWLLAALGAGSCIGLITVLRSPAGCRGLPCSVATYGGHPLVTLVVAALGTTALLTTATFTQGLTHLPENALWAVIPASALTLAAVTGILAVLIATALILLTALAVIVLIFASFADHT
jgi:hypothetical protein